MTRLHIDRLIDEEDAELLDLQCRAHTEALRAPGPFFFAYEHDKRKSLEQLAQEIDKWEGR